MLNHCGTVTLQTPRLVLRPLCLDDAPDMYAHWANDPAVTRYLRWEPHRTWAETAELLYEWSRHYTDPTYYQWGICEKDSGVLFGSISLCPGEENHAWGPLAEGGPLWEPGYCLGRRWWGLGYAAEALCAVRDLCFDRVGGVRLACCHAAENEASGAVMRKAGFRYHHDSVYHKFNGTAVPCRVYLLQRGEKNG